MSIYIIDINRVNNIRVYTLFDSAIYRTVLFEESELKNRLDKSVITLDNAYYVRSNRTLRGSYYPLKKLENKFNENTMLAVEVINCSEVLVAFKGGKCTQMKLSSLTQYQKSQFINYDPDNDNFNCNYCRKRRTLNKATRTLNMSPDAVWALDDFEYYMDINNIQYKILGDTFYGINIPEESKNTFTYLKLPQGIRVIDTLFNCIPSENISIILPCSVHYIENITNNSGIAISINSLYFQKKQASDKNGNTDFDGRGLNHIHIKNVAGIPDYQYIYNMYNNCTIDKLQSSNNYNFRNSFNGITHSNIGITCTSLDNCFKLCNKCNLNIYSKQLKCKSITQCTNLGKLKLKFVVTDQSAYDITADEIFIKYENEYNSGSIRGSLNAITAVTGSIHVTGVILNMFSCLKDCKISNPDFKIDIVTSSVSSIGEGSGIKSIRITTVSDGRMSFPIGDADTQLEYHIKGDILPCSLFCNTKDNDTVNDKIFGNIKITNDKPLIKCVYSLDPFDFTADIIEMLIKNNLWPDTIKKVVNGYTDSQ